MPIVRSPPFDSTSDAVYNKRKESKSVVEGHIALMDDVHSRREYFYQRGLYFNGCRDSTSHGTMWLQTTPKDRWSRLKLIMRWCWRRSPPDVRWGSNEQMGGTSSQASKEEIF